MEWKQKILLYFISNNNYIFLLKFNWKASHCLEVQGVLNENYADWLIS